MGFKDEHPAATHRTFPFYFDDDYGICFGPCDYVPSDRFNYDLAIFYDDLDIDGYNYVEGRCSRWDVDNYSVIVETWLNKDSFSNLLNNITPGATKDLYTILGRPNYYDTTWQGNNTIRLYPTPDSQKMPNSKLKELRRDTICYVKNITSGHVPGMDKWVRIKIEGYISGSIL